MYEGWGEWARTLRPAATAADLSTDRYWLDPATNRVHVRIRNNGDWNWRRLKVCAQQYWGEDLGSRDRF